MAVLAATFTLTSPASAAEIEGVRFDDEIRVGESSQAETLRLHGLGLLRYRFVFRGYVAALYLSAGAPGDNSLDDLARRLELSYFWPIAGKDFAVAADQHLATQHSAEKLATLRERIDALHLAYVDVEPTDRYALTYRPRLGTELSLNGKVLITVPGADFAEAYFGIWLGQNPLDKGLRDVLLRKYDRKQ